MVKADNKPNHKAKVVVYTAISGGFDNLIHHKYISKDFDYVCYIDTPVDNPGVWEIRPLEDRGYDNNRNAKYYKIFPNKLFPEYDYSIWIDGNINVLKPGFEVRINQLIEKETGISAGIHFKRTCLYEEANVCIDNRIDNPDIIMNQVNYIRNQGFPEDYGEFFEMNIIFRRHNDKRIVELMRDWWAMIIKYSRRDQLSFMYVLYKNGLVCEKLFPQNQRYRTEFQFYEHKKVIYPALYVDTGNGFNEKDMIIQRVLLTKNGDIQLEFTLNKYKNIKKMRFDPVSGKLCSCMILNIETDGTFNHIRSCDNFYKNGKWDIFYTTDPKYIINGDFTKTTWIKITGRVKVINSDKIFENYIFNAITLKSYLKYKLKKIFRRILS